MIGSKLKSGVHLTVHCAFIIKDISFGQGSFWRGNVTLWQTVNGYSLPVQKSTEFDPKLSQIWEKIFGKTLAVLSLWRYGFFVCILIDFDLLNPMVVSFFL